ncbi:MAG: NAD(P)/FAD-dependent oxidoreductase [Hyphomonadaceae bacterium]
MDTFEADAVVIGAGVIGLACGRELARRGRDVLVLEAADAIATQTSSRNSEVVHAGLYYPTNSLKALMCVAGRRKLVPYCEQRGVEVQHCGKLVVAVTDQEAGDLDALYRRALANDVEDVHILTGEQARALEPALTPEVRAALHSRATGIFDSHAYFLALQGEIEDAGGSIALATPVVRGRVMPDGVELETGGDSPARIKAQLVVNAAGHAALDITRAIEGAAHYPELAMHWAKGNYFTVPGKGAFSQLIYPMHNSASLGLHLTIDLGGGTRLGPDVEWLPDDAGPPFDYRVNPARAEAFYGEVRRYWPGLPDGSITPGYSGVRPKLVGPGQPAADFMIEGPDAHGTLGLVNLFGIESPGLTSSLAIAERVAELLDA